MDVVALQVVTVGEGAEEQFQTLQGAGEYSEAYYSHGLAVQTAEATAEYIHRHIRRELGLAPGRGKRYSWGYPAIPDLDDHAKVFALLPAESELGMSLTDTLLTLAEQMRLRRRQRAEELAHKAAVKMLIPLVFFIFPALFIVILGPAAQDMIGFVTGGP